MTTSTPKTAPKTATRKPAAPKTATHETVTPGGRPEPRPIPFEGVPAGALGEVAMDRNLGMLGRHLDAYLAAVAGELRARGVITGTPQRTDPAQRLFGSIVLDCTAVRVAAWAEDPAVGGGSLGGALYPERPAPVVLTWDEELGWCAGLHHDPTSASRCYLRSGRLPAPAEVAEFVVWLALDPPLGAAHPPLGVDAAAVARPALHGCGCSDDPPPG